MSYNPILERNYLLELVKYADYPSIIKLCTLNKQLDFICRNDIQIRNIINRKRISDKTDRFLQTYPQFPLILAARIGDVEIVDELINRGYDPSIDNNEAILVASSNGHLPVVDRLLQDERVDPSDLNNRAIILASENGHLRVVDRLLQDERVDPSDSDNLSIRRANEIGNLPVVERLLQDERIDPTDFNNRLIKNASESGYSPVVERLLRDYRVWNSLSNQEKEEYFKQIGKRIYSPLPPNTVPFPPSLLPSFVQTSYPLPPPPPTGLPFTTQFPTNLPNIIPRSLVQTFYSIPTRQTPLPTRQAPLPTRQAPLPTRQSPLLNRQTPLPTRQTPLLNRQAPLPTRQTPLPTRQGSL